MTSQLTSTELCSDVDAHAGDDPRGSSATFSQFLLIEHRGSFSKVAAADAVTAVYGPEAPAVQALETAGFRPFVIRPVGRGEPSNLGSAPYLPRFVGRAGAGATLERIDRAPTPGALAALSQLATRASEPLFAVCTNGSRDRCCAVKGRDLAQQLRYELDGSSDDGSSDDAAVVEISHLGGHRFAATMLVLPWGYSYGRLDIDAAVEIAYAAQDGLVHPRNLRGRSDLDPAAQVADAYWRAQLGPAPIDAVRIEATTTDGPYRTVSATVRNRSEHLRLERTSGVTIGQTRCGGKPIQTAGWTITEPSG